ncbi:anti-anti-sigma factor [Pseudonocardia sediminis]|uniref:Anti-sigma factor antagonist n=1 Tax=Pseudonocardia sediminis TaxID=1397368 RepID=A0A4Q7UYA4_PSEST|nr:STAS domain-containing protein [Pseudonocardia sediminis]RZT86916.1 anti-anti-sigma factor [Pseudonocardia sediminis]
MSGSEDRTTDDDRAVGVTAGVPMTFGALSVTARPHPAGTVVLHARGEIDTATAPFLAEQIASTLAGASGLLLDLGGVSFLASAGLAALISARDEAAAAGVGFQLACGDSRSARRALQVTGTLELFDVVDPTPGETTSSSTPIFSVPDLRD